jgi:hypothetical protein
LAVDKFFGMGVPRAIAFTSPREVLGPGELHGDPLATVEMFCFIKEASSVTAVIPKLCSTEL